MNKLAKTEEEQLHALEVGYIGLFWEWILKFFKR